MTHLEASPASLCKCRGVPRFFQSPPILTSRHRQKQRRPFSQHVCASVAHTAEGALSVKPASVKGGTFTVNGSLETGCDPELIYQTLVDYPNLPNVFKNLDACRSWTEAGQKKLLQVCRWEFLIFSGTFETTLSVSEHPDQGKLVFGLLESGFMRNFHVCWQLKPLQNGRTLVQHQLSVDPIVDPPPAFRGYAEKIFYRQVENLLSDLQQHLQQ